MNEYEKIKGHKNIDLHEAEWRREGKKEPIFGHGAFWFFRVTVPAFLIALAAGYVVKLILIALFDSPFD